jgi:hypothetical protein
LNLIVAPQSDSQAWLSKRYKWLQPIFLLFSFLGLLSGAFDSVAKFVAVKESHFYLVVTICYVIAVLFAWQWQPLKTRFSPRLRKRLRWLLIILATGAFIFAVGHTYWEYHLRKTHSSRVPIVIVPPRHSPATIPTPARKPSSGRLVLESFGLDEDSSSFMETQSSTFGSDKKHRTFEYDNTVTEALRKGECVGPRGNRPMQEVVPLLRARLEKTDHRELQRYIETPEDLSRVMRDRGDLFEKIMFTPADLESLQQSAPGDYRIVREWLLGCIGLQQPVLTLRLHNNGADPLLLTHVVYHVSEVGQYMGGVTGPVIPLHTYNHTLKHEVGDQTFPLQPPFQIAAQDRGSFNLRLFSASQQSGLFWFLQIEVLTADGESVTTEPIEIVMSK